MNSRSSSGMRDTPNLHEVCSRGTNGRRSYRLRNSLCNGVCGVMISVEHLDVTGDRRRQAMSHRVFPCRAGSLASRRRGSSAYARQDELTNTALLVVRNREPL